MKQEKLSKEEKTAPVKKFKAGGITVSVWVNTNDKGTFSSYTLQRTYKDKNDEWQHTNTLRGNDLHKAVLVLQEAMRWEFFGTETDE